MGGDDSLFGGKGSDLIYGGDGSDSLQGAEGYDTLYGGDGADRLEGSNLGSATLYGGAGDDVYLVRNDWTYSSSNFFELAGEGIDTVLLVHGDLHLAPNFERLVVRDPSGRGHALAGNDEANTLIAGKGNDVLEGGLGNDTLTGGRRDRFLRFPQRARCGQCRYGDRFLQPVRNHLSGRLLQLSWRQDRPAPGGHVFGRRRL
jgi:serralysin